MNLSNVKVGDRLLLVEPGRRYQHEPQTVEVTKVGRAYVYAVQINEKTGKAFDWKGTPYHIETGEMKSEFGMPGYLTTPEDLADQKRRDALRKRLRELGVDFRVFAREYPSSTLAAMVELLEAP